MSTTVYVKNIGLKTEDKEIRDFFSFCGKISSIDVTPSADGNTKDATVTFESATAGSTALLLGGTKLGDHAITVSRTADATSSSTPPHDDDSAPRDPTIDDDGSNPNIPQESKPRTRILAEYLAHGYLVADTGLQKAIALDEKHGVTARFAATLQALEEKTHATDKARGIDQTYGLTARAGGLLSGLSSYFEKATHTPTGQKIVGFYTQTQREVADIYGEAKRLAELKKEEHGGSSYKASGLDKVFGRFQKGEGENGAASTAEGTPAAASAEKTEAKASS